MRGLLRAGNPAESRQSANRNTINPPLYDPAIHATALEAAGIRVLTEGDRVSFELEDDRRGRGKQAGQLKKI